MNITVITISYNAEKIIENTILSVINQKNADFEYIIVDGNSSDGTIDIIKKYGSQITKWKSEPDTGIYNAMNKGIDMASGDYCIFMNAGDVFAGDDILMRVTPYLFTNKDVYTGYAIYTNSGHIVEYKKPPRKVDYTYFYRRSLCHQASFIKTELLHRYHYDEKYKMVSDGKFWKLVLGLNNGEYEAIHEDICCFDTSGLTYTQRERGKKEDELVIKELYNENQITCSQNVIKRQKHPLNLISKYEGLERRILLVFAKIFKQHKLKYIK